MNTIKTAAIERLTMYFLGKIPSMDQFFALMAIPTFLSIGIE